MVQYEIPILTDSDPNSGAQNVSTGTNDAGARFYINLEHPVEIPRNALNCTVEVQKATVWNVVPNILTGVNDHFRLIHLATTYNATIPQGLYGVSQLQTAMEREITAVGAPAGLFSLLADAPTQKIVLRLNQAGSQIDLTMADSFRIILGFNSQLVPAAPSVGIYQQLGDVQAAFNTINTFLIHSDIVQNGIRINGEFSNIIDEVLIDVSPGSQITQKNNVPTRVPANNLIGGKLKSLGMWLTSNQNELVNTNGETWTALLVIRYTLP